MPKQIINRLERLDYLIRSKSTGTPDKLASRLGISRSCLYTYLSLLKDLGAPVSYCRKRNSFYYAEPGRLFLKFLGVADNSSAKLLEHE